MAPGSRPRKGVGLRFEAGALQTVERLTDAFRPFRMWICFLLRVAAARGAIAGVEVQGQAA